jgi:TetR/AcrR family transcriptional repressor of nem operon
MRTRSYDESEVLSGAMHAFRRSGYAGLSIPALEAATGLSTGSIYNSFGDKRGIFLASFEHYLHAVLGRRIAQFAKPESGLPGLRQLFLTLLREPNGETFGCLITNSAIEFGAEGELAAGAIARGLDMLERLFAERLSAAKSAGVLPDKFDVRAGAVRLLALYQGVLVLIRGGFDLRAIRAAIHQEFDYLEGKTI